MISAPRTSQVREARSKWVGIECWGAEWDSQDTGALRAAQVCGRGAVQVGWGGGYLRWPPGKKQALGVSGKRDPFAFLPHCKSVRGQFRAPNSWSLSLGSFPQICDGVICQWSYSAVCVLCREMLWEWESRGMRHMRCVHATWPERSSTGVLYKRSLGHEVSLTSVQFFFAVIKTLSMPVMQNRKHKENVFSSAIILACLCVYESFLLHLEGWDAELFSKEVSKVHPHSSQQLAWQKGYSKWLALFPSILPLET